MYSTSAIHLREKARIEFAVIALFILQQKVAAIRESRLFMHPLKTGVRFFFSIADAHVNWILLVLLPSLLASHVLLS